jgi:hypothetical protein
VWRGVCERHVSHLSCLATFFRSRSEAGTPLQFRSASLGCWTRPLLQFPHPSPSPSARTHMQCWVVDLGSGRATSNACTGTSTSANAETTLAPNAKVMDQAHHPFSPSSSSASAKFPGVGAPIPARYQGYLIGPSHLPVIPIPTEPQGSKKTSDSESGCQNKPIKEAPKLRLTYLNLFIV